MGTSSAARPTGSSRAADANRPPESPPGQRLISLISLIFAKLEAGQHTQCALKIGVFPPRQHHLRRQHTPLSLTRPATPAPPAAPAPALSLFGGASTTCGSSTSHRGAPAPHAAPAPGQMNQHGASTTCGACGQQILLQSTMSTTIHMTLRAGGPGHPSIGGSLRPFRCGV